MGDPIELEANDLAAMLCSRVCHDLINPVGAINNGLQSLEDPSQTDMVDLARQMVSNAAKQALARLEYARLAFGASSAPKSIPASAKRWRASCSISKKPIWIGP